ncbi:glycosyltransferase family 1 protein [Arthrobacter glacialis]|nr:glycosyltransferase family 1 protein [Arthrobacter glacialis]
MVVNEIIQEWKRTHPSDELLVAVPRKNIDTLSSVSRFDSIVPTKLRLHPLINGLELPILARRHKCDVILAQNFGPLQGSSVTLVHDVLFQSNPSWFTRIELIYCALIPMMAKLRTRVVTTTITETHRILRHNPRLKLGAPIGLGISSELNQATPLRPSFNLTNRSFILTVGRLNIRKNISNTILGALKSKKITPKNPLVIVGERSGSIENWPAGTQQAIQDGSVLFTGYLSNAELRWLYENCLLFCFLSLDEGFGLPPIEASSFGATVLVSDIDVMHENLGDGCEYVDPTSIDQIAVSIAKIVESSTPTPARIDERFKWPSVVQRLRAELEKA